MKKTLVFMMFSLVLASCGSKEQKTQAEQTVEPSVADAQQPQPLATPSEEEIFQIATKPTPLDKVPNVFAEPMDINMFDNKTDPNAQKITDYQVLSLPNGFGPDGITIAKDGTIYVASILSGKIVKGKTDGSKIIDPLVDINLQGGAWGMDLTDNDKYLWVSGGLAGTARNYDATNGELVADVTLANFGVINDLIVTDNAVYLTNSGFPILYKIPLNGEGKQSGKPSVIKLSSKSISDIKSYSNLNGIEYDKDNNVLIANDSAKSTYFSINPETGEVREIDLQGESTSNDGIALDGNLLHGVESPKNQVSIFELSDDLASAKLVKRLTSDIFDFPTLIALDKNYYYVVNGKLTTKNTDSVPYEIIKFSR